MPLIPALKTAAARLIDATLRKPPPTPPPRLDDARATEILWLIERQAAELAELRERIAILEITAICATPGDHLQ